MKKNIVKEISFDGGHADVLLDSDYNVTVPKPWVLQKNKDNNTKTLLKPGDKFVILSDKFGIDFAYIYTKHFRLVQIPEYPDLFMQNVPFRDRMVLKWELQREIRRRGKIPHMIAYKNLRDIIRDVR